MRGLIIAVVLVAILASLTFVFVSNSNSNNEESTSNQDNSQATDANTDNSQDSSTADDSNNSSETVSSVTISYTDNGFSPSSTSLKLGGTLTWVNNSGSELQVAVNPHPTHTGDKAITEGEFVLALSQGQSKTVTVNKSGTFGYHNHLESGDTGSIRVE